MMKLYLLFVICFVCINSLPHGEYPTLANLNWEAAGNYRASGVSVNRIVSFGPYTLPYQFNLTQMIQEESDAFMVIDVTNKRMLLDMGSGGQYYYFQDRSYVILPGRPCGYVNFTYNTQVSEYGKCVQTDKVKDKHNGKVNVFTGLNLDVGSCHLPIGLTMEQDLDGFIIRWQFAHPWSANGLPILVSGAIVFDNIHPIYGSVSNSYFDLPSNCSSPVDYCATIFPL